MNLFQILRLGSELVFYILFGLLEELPSLILRSVAFHIQLDVLFDLPDRHIRFMKSPKTWP
ncbi:hypothetical protein [Rossellomorea marisflavi]|uniref:hypothetical protein n=1 Tax=Rossellomorea marisflavi TaxID=189381 RepID=UPI0035157B1F